MPAEGIKLIGALYRDPTVENLKRMMNVFVYDSSSLTEELYQQRLAISWPAAITSKTSSRAPRSTRSSSATTARACLKSRPGP
jgi:hypothetical protein